MSSQIAVHSSIRFALSRRSFLVKERSNAIELWSRLKDTAVPREIVLHRITVIDATGAPARQDMTVVIVGDRISGLDPADNARVPKDARVVDATGKFLIPGLWDMHVHWGQKDYLPLFIANGVTGVRVMAGQPLHQRWRKEIEGGTLLGPRMTIASTIVDGPKPWWPNSIAVGSEAEARQAVIKVTRQVLTHHPPRRCTN
jgi:hypothetical protein